jgi:predicted DNA-binding transcriptional regulator AlpA
MKFDDLDGVQRLEDRLLSWKRVREVTGLSRTTAWRLQQQGEFPDPVAISPGRVCWRESEIAAWQASRRARREIPDRVKAPPRSFGRYAKASAPTAATASTPPVPARTPADPQPDAGPGPPPGQIKFDF